MWKKNITKKLKNEGKEYTSSKSNKVVAEKKMGTVCSDKCRLKCSKILTDIQRANIFRRYWSLGNLNSQREFILRHISQIDLKYRSRLTSNRSLNYKYSFSVDNEDVRVCKTMFMSTLAISSRMIFTTIHKNNDGILEQDKRGRHGNYGNAVNEEIKNSMRLHIKSFPTTPSHYCRANSSKQFIDGSLNIALMYRLHVEKCKSENNSYGKQSYYTTIFNQEFNISFHRPKKDLCMTCESYKNANDDDKVVEEDKYRKHQEEKTLSRKEKDADILLDDNVVVCCFDLQAVLISPRGEVSQFYYKRRLASYNFTVFKNKSKEGICYFWNETIGRRGSNEIGSCLLLFLQNQENENKDIIFYADNCGGQNKNKYVISMLVYCVKKLNIRSVTLKFLIVGHTQNEGDSMHARIEGEAKRILHSGPIYEPSQWVSVIKSAKKNGKPYTVYEVQKDQFFDLKKLSSDIGNNYKLNQDGENVLWNEIKMIKIEKDNPTLLKYKTSYKDNDFKIIDIRRKCRKSLVDLKLFNLNSDIKISLEKKKDLVSLCHSNAIPKNHWSFYETLEAEAINTEADESD